MSEFLRDTAGQKIPVGAIYDLATGTLQTSGFSVAVSKDGGSESAGAGSLTTLATGAHIYAPTQAETDCVLLTVTVHKTDCSRSTAGVYTTTKRVSDLTDGAIDVEALAAGIAAELPPVDAPTEAEIYGYFTDGTRANAFKATGFAVPGDEMALTSAERSTLAGVIDSRLLDDGDATDLIAGIVARIGTVDIDETSLVAALKAALFHADDITNKLRVSAAGKVDVATNADKTGYSLTTAPLDAAATRSAVGLGSANLDTQLAAIAAAVAASAIRSALGLASANVDTQLSGINSAVAASAIRTALGLAAANLDTQLSGIADSFDGLTDGMAEGVAAALASIQLSAQSLLTISGTKNLVVIRGDHYVDAPTRFDIDTSSLPDPDVDLSSKKLIIAAKREATKFAVSMPIQGTAGNHYALFNPPSSLTETWVEGQYELLYRIEWGSNQYQTVGDGILDIRPFDIGPSDITALT